ncbi:MAG: hypothetical protein IKI57_03560 [Clostridia bacterium]|nr:hypothetical protein [Clostridia bacterium]
MERTSKREWNTGAGIPISSLSQDELKEAIHEWAEGSQELENFLWECYHNDVTTIGSHVSEREYGDFYVQFIIEESNRRNLEKIVFEAYKSNNMTTDFAFNGNPFSGANWNKPTLSIGPAFTCRTQRYLFNLINAFDSEYEYTSFVPKSPCLKIFELYDLLKSKRCPISIHLRRISYVENIVVVHNDMYKVANNPIRDIFEKAGFRTYSINHRMHDSQFWSLISIGQQGLTDDLNRLKDTLETELTGELPDIDESIMDEHFVLYLKSIEFGNSREGIEKMNDWINSHKYYPEQHDVHY